MKIGLIGESPNDTASVANLLSKKYKEISFLTLLDNVRGGQLDDTKIKHFLRKEYEILKPNIIIFIRDLDGLKSDRHQLQIRKQYFTEFNSVVDKKGIYLLNIYEIEALILSDIDTFNKEYNTQIESIENVMEIVEPKEFLKKFAKGYLETHNAKIFQQLNFQQVLGCAYFKEFILNFNELLFLDK